MKKISIVIADEDGLYLKQLTNYLVKSTDTFEVYSFSRQDSLARFLAEQNNMIDILMLSENMRCAAADAYRVDTKVLLADGEYEEIDGYQAVKRYQKTSNLISTVMLIYGKKSGKADKLAYGGRNTRFVGVYSPVGGSGKTTISLLLAHQLGMSQKRVFYQSYEHVSSIRGFLPESAQVSLSDLLVDIHSGETGIGLRIVSKMYSDQKLGFSYVNLPDSSLEINEVSLDEQISLIEELDKIGQFDIVMLDFDSELTEEKVSLLKLCDWIVVPFLADQLSLNKLMRFFQELKQRDELSGLSGRMIFVANKAGPSTHAYLQQCGLYQECTPATTVMFSEQLANIGFALRNGQELGGGLQAVADQICGRGRLA